MITVNVSMAECFRKSSGDTMKEHLKDSNLTDGNDQDKPQSCLHKVISTSETAATRAPAA